MHERCHAVSHGYYACLGQARYLVRAEMPRESEPPMFCFTHAKRIVRQGTVPQGVLYRQAPDGHGWVIFKANPRRRRSRAGATCRQTPQVWAAGRENVCCRSPGC
jgi:hypothetical protein